MDDSISRQAAINAFLTELTKRERKNLLHTWSTVEVKYFVADMLEKLPSAQPDVPDTYVGDMISRQAALDALKKLEKPAPTAQHLSAIFDCEDTIKALPSAQPVNIAKLQPNCNQVASDCISRAAAIDALGEEPLVWHEDDAGEVAERNQWRRDVAAIKALPSAHPEWTTDVNDILAYLDGVVHPLVSPENWNVYSELHDMVSGLLKPWEGR